MDSLVDMCTLSDACTHSNQGVGLDEVTGTYTKSHTGVHIFPCNYPKVCSRHGESCGQACMY